MIVGSVLVGARFPVIYNNKKGRGEVWDSSCTCKHIHPLAMFSSSRSIDVPTVDVCSWVFENDTYDEDKPVRTIMCDTSVCHAHATEDLFRYSGHFSQHIT